MAKITLDMLRIYRRFDGDVDAWVRLGTTAEQSIMTDVDFHTIGSFIQRCAVVKGGLAAQEFPQQVSHELNQATSDEAVAREIMEMA